MQKIWNRLPLAKKFLIATILIFLTFCVVFFLGQLTFFGKYYKHMRLAEVKSVAEQIADGYAGSYNDSDSAEKIAEIADAHDCYVMILDKNGAVRHVLSYSMAVMTDSGELLKLTLDNAAHDKNFTKLELERGDRVEISYFSGDELNPDNVFFPLSISKDGQKWEVFRRDDERRPRENDKERPSLNVMTASGTITSVVLGSGQSRNLNAERAAATKAAMEWLSGRSEESLINKTGSYYYTDTETADKFGVAVKSVTGSEGDVVFAISPLNMVDEAVRAATSACYFWFLFAMGAACVLGVVFSKVVTKPIIEMTDVTKKMASLDFTSKCEYSSNDEMGELADNINNLSDTLDFTIHRLQEANEKLVADIEKERAIENSRREFVAAASHELKTPLGVIRAYTEALIDGVSQSKQPRYMQVIVDETEKMDRLILDMLDNSKLESGAQKMNPAEYDLCDIVKKLAGRFDEVTKSRGIKAEVKTPDSPVVKRFDIDLIERVLTNFMTNAVRNTPDGGSITCEVLPKADSSVTVSVENSGSHIEDEDMEYIWDRFYKADKSRRRSVGGTGLGLSIAKNILIMHKADYGAQNTKDGVKFFFTLK